MDRSQSLRAQYEQSRGTLELVAREIEEVLKDTVRGLPRIDMVTTRVKGVESFVGKALRADPTSGAPKYTNPLDEIQDQIGARIVVFYKSDVQEVADTVLQAVREIEDQAKGDMDPRSFGYEARHFVCMVPPNIREVHHPHVEFFELQISTLFQHAWAQGDHDLGYKPSASDA